MSLVSGAIRTATVLALWENTLAGDRIYDSALQPVDELVTEDPQPFITISVDEGATENTNDPSSTPAMQGVGMITLVIDICLAQKVTVQGANGDTETSVVIPATEAGLEWALDMIARQVTTVLTANGGWSDIWRTLMVKTPDRVFRVRGGDHKGVKFAARQLVATVEPVSDPIPGDDFSLHVLSEFIAALREIPSDPVLGQSEHLTIYVQLADAIESSAIMPTTLTNWNAVAAQLGIPIAGVDALGLSDLGTPTEFIVVPADTDPTFTVDADTP